jgi:hypothetical protein
MKPCNEAMKLCHIKEAPFVFLDIRRGEGRWRKYQTHLMKFLSSAKMVRFLSTLSTLACPARSGSDPPARGGSARASRSRRLEQDGTLALKCSLVARISGVALKKTLFQMA